MMTFTKKLTRGDKKGIQHFITERPVVIGGPLTMETSVCLECLEENLTVSSCAK